MAKVVGIQPTRHNIVEEFRWVNHGSGLGASGWSSVILVGCSDDGVVPDPGYQYVGGGVCCDCTVPSSEKAFAKKARHLRGTAGQEHEEPLNRAYERSGTDGVEH